MEKYHIVLLNLKELRMKTIFLLIYDADSHLNPLLPLIFACPFLVHMKMKIFLTHELRNYWNMDENIQNTDN